MPPFVETDPSAQWKSGNTTLAFSKDAFTRRAFSHFDCYLTSLISQNVPLSFNLSCCFSLFFLLVALFLLPGPTQFIFQRALEAMDTVKSGGHRNY